MKLWASSPPLEGRERRAGAGSTVNFCGQRHQGTGEGATEPRAGSFLRHRGGERFMEGFEFAQFDRPLAADLRQRTTEQAERHFGGQIAESCPDQKAIAVVPHETGRGLIDCVLDRRIGARHSSRQCFQPPGVEFFRGQPWHQVAQPRTGEPRIAVGGIVREGDAGYGKRGGEARLGDGEEWTHKREPTLPVCRERRNTPHPAQTRDTAAARKPEQHGLRLIVECVRRENVPRAGLVRGITEQAIARIARRFLNAGFGLSSGPAHCVVIDAEFFGEPRNRARLARRLLAKAMIDRDGDQFRRPRKAIAPARREPHQCGRVRAARNRKHQGRCCGEITEQRSNFRLGQGCIGSAGAQGSVPRHRPRGRAIQ